MVQRHAKAGTHSADSLPGAAARGYGVSPELPDFLTDLRGALAGGAAGWCFHNGDQRDKKDRLPQRSFDLHAQRLFVQLDDVELALVSRLNEIVRDFDHGQ